MGAEVMRAHGIDEPALLRRVDGTSVYEVAGSAVYTSTAVLAAEQLLVATAGLRDRHAATPDAVAMALLEQAAVDAVKQWRYSPTKLNGVPVEVIMTVTVNFRLGG